MTTFRSLGIAAVTAGALLVAPVSALAVEPAGAPAAKKPQVGLDAPKKVKVGQKVTATSVFKAKTSGCFEPSVDWGDGTVSQGGVSIDGGNLTMNFSGCNKKAGKSKFKLEKDTHKHTYTEPGVYTIKVGADAMFGEAVKTKGKKRFTQRIIVTGPNGEMPANASSSSAADSTSGKKKQASSVDAVVQAGEYFVILYDSGLSQNAQLSPQFNPVVTSSNGTIRDVTMDPTVMELARSWSLPDPVVTVDRDRALSVAAVLIADEPTRDTVTITHDFDGDGTPTVSEYVIVAK